MDNDIKTSSLELIRQARLKKMELDIELKALHLQELKKHAAIAEDAFLGTVDVANAILETFKDGKHNELKARLIDSMKLNGNEVACAVFTIDEWKPL